jgi:hypothetical protein
VHTTNLCSPIFQELKKEKFVALDSLGVSVDILGKVKCLNWMSISCHGWIPRLSLSPAYFQDEVP